MSEGRGFKPKRIILAPQTRLVQVEHLAPRFFKEVLDMDYGDYLVTDESDLSDFLDDTGSIEICLQRMRAHYLIDVGRAGSIRVVDLLEFLAREGIVS